MADFLIDPNRYQHRMRQNQQTEQKKSPQAQEPEEEKEAKKPEEQAARQEKRAERRRTPEERRMDRYHGLVNWLREENRRRLEELRRTKPPEKKKPPIEEIRLKIQEMRSKLRKGGRLTGEEKAYLARNAPEELAKLLQAERERSAFKARLNGCRSKEEADHAYQGACTSAMTADLGDPDLSSVIIGQLSAAMREMEEKPTEAQLERQEPRRPRALDCKG